MLFAAATKFNEGTTTSSPGPQSTAASARCSAAVPLATAKACSTPQNAAKDRSSSATRGPMLHHPERTTSSTAASSSSSTRTSASGTVQPASATATVVPGGFTRHLAGGADA